MTPSAHSTFAPVFVKASAGVEALQSGLVEGRRIRQARTPLRRGNNRRSVMLASGRYAMLDDGMGFSLVAWKPGVFKAGLVNIAAQTSK